MTSSPPFSLPSTGSPASGQVSSDQSQSGKRGFSTLYDALEISINKKRKGTGNDPLAPFRRSARWVGRGIDPFVRLWDAFRIAAAYNFAEDEAVDDEEAQIPQDLAVGMTARDIQLHRSVCRRTKALLPNFDQVLEAFEDTPGATMQLLDTMNSTMSQCRSDDIGTLKTYGLNIVEAYALKPNEKVMWEEKKQSYPVKSTRGFNDNIFGRLICPHKYSVEFEANPDVFCRNALQSDGGIIILASDLPAFLYDGAYNSEAIDEGLLRGILPVMLYKCIFRSPSLVTGGSQAKGRFSHSQIHGLTRVTPHTIAYVCMLTRFFCSAIASWREMDGTFSYKEFYSLDICGVFWLE
ncbi:hypothetical protein EW026_g8012 [Hermanssonia centrifuga]|uniref:Uncharacterized protein n=1 Tax=Hermanssonia centrifuga TaxID=98765 RepID=A0A4S4K5V3_9APHY|nr:hypothetical protein EW026_g8012 [Hermanssonia centrifuga]